MAASLLALLDDITSVLDDVAALTKVAAKKTAGVLGDDLALNAQQVGGVRADRELPVVWAVAKGSAINKLILVPAAVAISAVAPWLVTPLLMVGGLYLCFEGAEKIAHKLLHKGHAPEEAAPAADAAMDVAALEKQKVKGAVRTDFILSAEIVAITLGSVRDAPLGTRLAVMAGVAALMTVGVYGVVAAIVKLDDLGQLLVLRSQRGQGPAGAQRVVGTAILRAAPLLMKALSIAGTAAMFLVGGGILAHGVPGVERLIEGWGHAAGAIGAAVLPPLAHALLGALAGLLVVGGVAAVKRLRGRKTAHAQA